jgi:glutathione S-transferase
VAHQCDYDLQSFPAIRSWLARIASEPGHVTMEHNPAAAMPAL